MKLFRNNLVFVLLSVCVGSMFFFVSVVYATYSRFTLTVFDGDAPADPDPLPSQPGPDGGRGVTDRALTFDDIEQPPEIVPELPIVPIEAIALPNVEAVPEGQVLQTFTRPVSRDSSDVSQLLERASSFRDLAIEVDVNQVSIRQHTPLAVDVDLPPVVALSVFGVVVGAVVSSARTSAVSAASIL